ncbi:MAG: sodium:proton antiporter NhaD [Gammaproteobacteria bacterium]|jgi:NhaD family Na+/H+ antiporter
MRKNSLFRILGAGLLAFLVPAAAFAAVIQPDLDLTANWAGYASLVAFVLAYALVMAEEYTDLRKSKPVMLAAGLIWAFIAVVYADHGIGKHAEHAVQENLEEYAELLLFLLTAMTYVNVMTERNVFEALRSWLIRKGFGYRKLFWITGTIAFFLSPMLDNLTTALVLCAVVLAVGADNPKFIGLACINIVVAANAGGAYSPFGDITTLMVWQAGVVKFGEFFDLFIPAAVNFVVPAAIMHFAIPKLAPRPSDEVIPLKRGAKRVIVLFGLTVATAVIFHKVLDMPPFLGMMMGLAYLQFFGYYLKRTHVPSPLAEQLESVEEEGVAGDILAFDVFEYIARVEWDTLMFFYGVILAVGGLGFIGYLSMTSQVLYVHWNPTYANTLIGVLSAIVDNIPIMAAVIHMNPDMSHGQWLLITLTAGVGGSLLSIGSAAGVALMGQARGRYTFMTHLKWTWAVALGYVGAILVHLWLNTSLFMEMGIGN